jgi:predicted molibdopterin-dependent oxidoreductase YjgC
MFARLPEADAAPCICLTVDGSSVRARQGDSVAAALLAAGYAHCRTTPIGGGKRAPYCMMGVCFDCLVTIDGIGNRQSCLVQVGEGMSVELQRGKRDPVA